jgi:hypothetical protein
MTSQINPNNIDGAYPVAGQDNNSQGFRDNFTNTGTNFQYAADEITDLQSKAILKAALTGTTLNNDMGTNILSNATLQNMAYTSTSLGSLSSTVTLDYSLGPTYSLTTNGSVQLAFTNLPAPGRTGAWTLAVTVASTAHTLTFPISVSVNTNGIRGLNPATNIMTFVATGTYTFAFTTNNGGTTITIQETNNLLAPFNNSAETITANANVNMLITTSIFSTTGNVIAVLGQGVPGQIKTFVASNIAANTVATVTSANVGWNANSSGNIRFTSSGQTATVQCVSVGNASVVNLDWYVIGSYGANIN